MRKLILTSVVIFLLLMATSCQKSDSDVSAPDNPDQEENGDQREDSDGSLDDDAGKVISPLDGLKYFPEELEKRPVAISIDNHPQARQQAGLSQAEIIYECEVEFPFTRYLCIFLAKEPEMVGPVRSARPYLIYYALENDGIFVHVGGSQDAFDEIARLSVADVDGLYSGAMWRYNDTGKYAPHNMYTDLHTIRDEAERYGYRREAEFDSYTFSKKDRKLSSDYSDTEPALNISITYNHSNNTKYTYDDEQKVYLRFKDGEEHVDELTEKQLTAKNIFILSMTRQVLDNEGRLALSSVGGGEGYYVSDGEMMPVTWQKISEKARTKFYVNDEELILNPGNTWIQAVSQDTVVEFNLPGGED